MTVRAKFTVTKIERQWGSVPVVDADGTTQWQHGEVHTIHMSPVSGNSDPAHENTKFWHASPSGSLQLGCVHPAAVAQFELGKAYFLDFTRAD